MTLLTIRSADFPAHERIAAFQDVVSHITKLEVAPEEPERFCSQTSIGILPGVVTGWGGHSASTATRTVALAADMDDNVMFHIPLVGGYSMQQRGGERVECTPGTIYLDPCEVPGIVQFHGAWSEGFYVSVPRPFLVSAGAGLGTSLRRLVPMTAQWRLLLAYARGLHDELTCLAPQEAVRCAAHVQDLVLMALDGARAAEVTAIGRGVRVARLKAIKADIECDLTSDTLSTGALARRHGVSDRYIRALFASEGTSFSDYVRLRRLLLVHRMLSDPARASQKIGDIALQAGFGDLSWFNTAFRQHFGATPSEVRAEALAAR